DRTMDDGQLHRSGLQDAWWREGARRTGATEMMRACIVAVVLIGLAAPLGAQRGGRGQGGAAASAQASAPLDLTGQWVSLVTDDWRWRMVAPPKGDVLYLPVNEAGRKV